MIEPLGPRLLVAVLRRSDLTAGGLHRPDSADDRPHHGRVLAVGNGDKIAELLGAPLEAGDVVMFGRFAGIRCDTDDDDERFLLLAEEVLARVQREPGWRITVTVRHDDDELGEKTGHPLGELDDARVVHERGVLGGVLVDEVPDEVRRAIVGAGWVTVTGERADETFTVWKADASRMFGTGGRFNAIAEDDSAGDFGGSPDAPLCGYTGPAEPAKP